MAPTSSLPSLPKKPAPPSSSSTNTNDNATGLATTNKRGNKQTTSTTTAFEEGLRRSLSGVTSAMTSTTSVMSNMSTPSTSRRHLSTTEERMLGDDEGTTNPLGNNNNNNNNDLQVEQEQEEEEEPPPAKTTAFTAAAPRAAPRMVSSRASMQLDEVFLSSTSTTKTNNKNNDDNNNNKEDDGDYDGDGKNNRPPNAPEREFVPATIGTKSLSERRLPSTKKSILRSSEAEINNSMQLDEVFLPQLTNNNNNNKRNDGSPSPNNHHNAQSSSGDNSGSTKNHNSLASSNASDESSILMDISWGSKLGCTDDIVGGDQGRRIGGGRVGSARLSAKHLRGGDMQLVRSNPNSGGSMLSLEGSDRTSVIENKGWNGKDSFRLDSSSRRQLLDSSGRKSSLPGTGIDRPDGEGEERGGGGEGKKNDTRTFAEAENRPPDTIPSVFKTARRHSASLPAPSVHVDPPPQQKQKQHPHRSQPQQQQQQQQQQKPRSRRRSSGILMQMKKSLTSPSPPTPTKTSAATSPSPPAPILRHSQEVVVVGGGGGSGKGGEGGINSAASRSRRRSQDSGGSGGRRSSDASDISEAMTGLEVLRASQQGARQSSARFNLDPTDRRASMRRAKGTSQYLDADAGPMEHGIFSSSAGAEGAKDRRGGGVVADAMNLNMSDSQRDSATEGVPVVGEEGGGGNNSRRKSGAEDEEMVAEVGGTAYLRASRKVWAMRIVVVMTFIVVSIIVTVLTYTFFMDMEEATLKSNYHQISTTLAADTAKALDRKGASIKALSKTYTGILGLQREGTSANEPPAAILSPAMSECAEGMSANWKRIWPNVTLPGHDEIVSAMLDVSKSRAAVFAPLLWGDHSAWEEYAAREALAPVEDVVSNGIRSSEYVPERDPSQNDVEDPTQNEALFGDSPSLSQLRVPVWQVAPAELAQEGIMWDIFSHPPYKAPIDRILRWTREEGGNSHANHQGWRSLTTHEEMAAGAVEGPPVAATELIPCAQTLLPIHLNPNPNKDPIHLSGPEFEGHNHERRWSLQSDSADGVCTALFYPVYDAHPSDNNSADISGVVAEIFSWTDIFMHIHHGHVQGDVVEVIVESKLFLPDGRNRSKFASYVVSNKGASFIGHGKLVGQDHEQMLLTYDFSYPQDKVTYTFHVYPTRELCYSEGLSRTPANLCIIAACFFFLSVLVFFVYDYFVNYRQRVIVQSAAQSARIVHSLYPEFVRDNLFGNDSHQKRHSGVVGGEAANTNSTQGYDEEDPRTIVCQAESSESIQKRKGLKSKVSDFVDTPATQLKRFLTHPMPSKEYDYNLCTEIGEMEPIAEVFEKTTVMLADIEGFTAWCSEREPSQVFRLLETVYREFDIEARKLGVFKVETVGDCYVAVTGLPDQRDDHAIVIAKYAVRCLLKFNVLTKRLEANLGPGTASLGMRFGLHSGPVTAGVLRGEKSRFQLFGDTINVASRMESTGEKNMIQVSQVTADLLNAAGKGHWLTPRDGPVSAKGKGDILTYWLQPNRRRPSMHGSLRNSIVSSDDARVPTLDRALRQSWKCIGIENDNLVAKERLIRWNAAILESFLLKIVDNRSIHSPADAFLDQFIPTSEDKHLSFSEKLSESVMFPDVAYRDDYYGVSSDMAISSEAQIELLEYVARIASMYRDVPFHNFDHASHVTMSANKLLNRVCTTFEDEEEDISSVAARTFGISADPLAQFVVVFSSLVHDVDHQGVPNAQLVKEVDPLAIQFDNRSVAEKRSITIAWNVLMEDKFRELQSLIFVNGDEMRRFKQLLINTVLATDIADKKRSSIGKIRWQKAFHPSQSSTNKSLNESNSYEKLDKISLRSLKATLVFEQIMQASDVAHTMQHWETFKTWNQRLYKELSKGYREGRGASDPRENWYGGEIGFFDFYIIPLAKKLKECGVFGSAASEYLDYALENRRRWEEEGTEIARKMVLANDELVAKATPPLVNGMGPEMKEDEPSTDSGPPNIAEPPENDVPAADSSSSTDSPREIL